MIIAMMEGASKMNSALCSCGSVLEEMKYDQHLWSGLLYLLYYVALTVCTSFFLFFFILYI